MDERAKYGPIPVSDKAKAEEDAKRAIEEAEKAAQVRKIHAVSNRFILFPLINLKKKKSVFDMFFPFDYYSFCF